MPSETDKADRADRSRRHADILDRLYAMVERKIDEIEARSGTGEALTPADGERDVRAMNTLARMLEKLAVLGEGPAEGKDEISIDPKAETIDAERLRGEIADRIARLRQGGAD